MKRLTVWLISGLVVVGLGLVGAGVLRPGSGVVAGPAEPPLVDGAPVLAPNTGPTQPETLALADATYARTYGAFEFQPVHSDLTFAPSGLALYATNVPAGGNSFKCPLDLPQGAQVKRIVFYVVDNSATDYMTLQLYRGDPSTSTQLEIESITTNGLPTSAAVKTLTMSVSPIMPIDNARYAYFLRYAPVITGGAHMLIGARVEYSVASGFVPFVSK